jgi:hypothetical protein
MTGPSGLLLELMVGLLVSEDWAEFVPGLVLDFMEFLELVEDLFDWFLLEPGSLIPWLFVMAEDQFLHFRI